MRWEVVVVGVVGGVFHYIGMSLPNKLLGGDVDAMEERKIKVERVGEWNRVFNVDLRKLLKGLAESTVSMGKIVSDPIEGVIGGIKGLFTTMDALGGKENDPLEHRAYKLLYNTLRQTLMRLVNEVQDVVKDVKPTEKRFRYNAEGMQKMIEQLNGQFENAELSIDLRFFEQPENLPLLDEVADLLRKWLLVCGVDPERVGLVLMLFRSTFVEELIKVWSAEPAYYQRLRGALETPFPTERVAARLKYNQYLVAQWKEKVFDSTLGLDQLYIPLRACYRLGEKAKDESGRRKMQVVDSEVFVWEWLQDMQEDKEVMVLRGGPGSGKSSLMKRIAMRLATETSRPVYFIPLNRIDFNKGIQEAILHFTQRRTLLGDHVNPFATPALGESRKPVFIFDGLDELSLGGDSGRMDAAEFVRQLSSFIDDHHLSIKVILTGRDLVIQLAERWLLNNHHQVLELLPYIVNTQDEEWVKYDFQDNKNLLSENQSDDWWVQYQVQMRAKETSVPLSLRKESFLPIRSQPLLNYLLAITYQEGLILPEMAENFNVLYETLLHSVYDRQWGGKRGFKHAEGLSEEAYFKVLEEVAVSTWLPQEVERASKSKLAGEPLTYMRWTGGIRTTSVNRIKNHFEQVGLEKLVDKFQGLAKSPYHRLIISTFMRGLEVEEGKDEMVEFTHKSFAEYLLARRIVRLVEEIYANHGLLETHGLTINAIEEWKKLGGQEDFSKSVFEFLCRELKLRWKETPEVAAQYQNCLTRLYSEALRWGFQIDFNNSRDAISQVRKFETNLLLTLSALARVSGKKTMVDWIDGDYPRKAIARLRIEHYPHSAQALSYLDLPKERNMKGVNFIGAKLSNTNLDDANFDGVNLMGAELQQASLRNTNFQGANLRGANLQETDLSRANLLGASLVGASLVKADIREANLEGSDLRGASLNGACLEGVSVSKSTRLPDIAGPLGNYFLKSTIHDGYEVKGEKLRVLLKQLST